MLTGNLEYMMSSLPNLSFSNSEALQHEVKSLFQKYALSNDASINLVSMLNSEAEKFLSTRQFQQFQKIQLATIHREEYQQSSYPVVAEFSAFVLQLKQELKAYRIQRKLGEMTQTNGTSLIVELPKNPLKAELYLLQLQWKKLEEISLEQYSNLSALIVYKLQLELLLRWWSFNEEVGFTIFQETLKTA